MKPETTLSELTESNTIGVPQANALDAAGFSTLGDIATAIAGGADLTELKWIGKPTVKALKAAIAEAGPQTAPAAATTEEADPALEHLAEILISSYPGEVERIGGSPVEVAAEILRSHKATVPAGGVGAAIHFRPIGPLRWDREKILRILGLDRTWDRMLPRREPPLGHNTHGYLLGILQGEEEAELAERCGFNNQDHARHQVEEDVFVLFEHYALTKARPVAIHEEKRQRR